MTTALVGSLGLIGAVVSPPPAQAAPGNPAISVTKQAPSSVLAGDPVTFTLTASNPSANSGAVPEYNTSLRDVLPLGLTYQSGSTSPSDIGDPTIITAGNGQQTLIWRDAFDLQVGSSGAITFTTTVDSTVFPVASTIRNTGNAYASTAPRYVPAFDTTGAPVSDPRVQPATSSQTTTDVSALKISKAEPSPESKLLRGVHDQTTVYTVTVTNTSKAATNGTSVTDYLPAKLEFLGCGQVDNSAGVEYPGAPSLTATPAVSANCPTPSSVDTVVNPPADGSIVYPAGVYTKVVWNIGTLASGQSVTIKYRAGVPLRANALFTTPPPPASLAQTANLDNNTGPSTRQVGDAAAQTNYVHAVGAYTGPVAAGGNANVVADSSRTVTVNDLRVYKSVAPAQFVAGSVSTYTLHVDSGEYTDNSAITITDTLPNGICPLDDVQNYVTGSPAECSAGAGFAPSLPYQSVTQNADGTFTVVFQPIAVAKDGSTVITYQGRDRTAYTGGSLAGEPPAAGDTFINNAGEAGTSTPVAATGYTGTQPVRDTTSATQTTSLGTLSKTVGARTTPMDCSSASYGTTNPVFAVGDRVCFQISVPFSSTNQTRNAVVSDFLPDNTAYESGSLVYPAANTVDMAQIEFDTSGASNGALSWKLGATTADGSTQVSAGKVFVARFSVRVTGPAAGPAPDKPGNIVKLRTTNSVGVAQSLRDGVGFRIAAVPPVGITKGVESVNAGAGNPANVDHVQVAEGDAVRFRVDVTNNGSATNSNDLPITSLDVWDVLPTGIRCAQINTIGDGTCTDPGDAGQPSFSGNDAHSAIVWPGSPSSPLAAGATRTLLYTMVIPAGSSVSSTYSNTAAVRSYDVGNDLDGTTTQYPAANIDTSVPMASYDTPAAQDGSDVFLPSVAVTKGVTSAVNETGNTGAENTPGATTQATIGEQTTFTLTATVPSHTTVYRASFTDTLPPGLTLSSATGTYRPDAGSATTAALPAGVTFSAAAPPTFAFPDVYDNTTGTDQVFTMVLVASVASIAGNLNGITRTNTGQFTSTVSATSNTPIASPSATAGVQIVEPQPALTKTNNAGASVTGAQTITYTLKPANAAGRPPLHDAWQLDCLPSGMTFAAYGALSGGVTTSTPVAGDGTNGCPSGSTVLAWNLGDLAGGTTKTLTYTATVDTTSSGKTSLVNVATLSGDTLAGTRTSPVDPGNANGRQYNVSASSTVTISGATAQKSVSPTSATVGQTVNYTTSAVLPPGVKFYNLSLIDQLPNGVDPSSVTQTGVTCTNADTTACSLTTATPLTSTAGSGSSTKIGWLLGDANSATQTRTVTVAYAAKIANVAAATAGAGLVNQLHVAWDNAARTPPTSSGASFNQSSPTVTATVTVLEPNLSITKSVDKPHPQPGQTFGYTLNVSNANTASTSAAHNVTVTDTVPTGVVVDPASISGGGTISGADPSTGGGIISWTLAAPLAKNSSTSLTYIATLASSSTLTTTTLTNTARITGYDSLASGGRHYTGSSATANVAPYFPKMTTTKTTPGGSTAYIGESFGWQVTARDTDTGDAYQVGTIDTLPANWTYDTGSAQVSVNGGPVSQVDPAVTTSSGVQTLTWIALGNLPAGTALTISYTATPQAAVTGTPGVGLAVNQTNSATSSAQDLTGATGNASGSYSNGPATASAHIASADVSLSKSVDTVPTAGQSGSWKLTVHNAGPDTATGPFTVSEPFAPSGVSNVAASGTGWSCSGSAPITCVRTNAADVLTSGVSFPVITVTYNVASTVTSGTQLSNTASVSAHTYDPTPANNSATANTTVGTSADIAIDKQLSSPELVAGQPVSYRLAVSNAGPSSAAGPITITDPLPAGTSFDSVSGAGWTCDPIPVGTVGATLSCALVGPLAVGATPDALIVTVDVASGRTADVVNTGSVSSATSDPNTGDNSDTVTTTPVVRTDMSIQKTHLTSPFVAGDPVDYRIDVTDNGPSDATGVEVADTLPPGLTYSSFASSDGNWSCGATGQRVTCDYAGSFTPGTSSVTLTVDLTPGLDVSQPIVNTAKVTSTTTDLVSSNNSDDDTSTVNAKADLSIVKTDSGTTTAGQQLTYHLAVHNAGPSDVPGTITVTDPLPAGLTYGSASGTGWDCGYDSNTRVITCTRAAGLTDAGDAPTIDVVTTVRSDVGPSTITNAAHVSSDITDPKLVNNGDSDQVDVVTRADISLTKQLTSTTPVLAGTDATFQLVASDAGPSDATNVSVVDQLPDHMSLDSYTGTGWSCNATGQTVTCTRGSIAAGADAPTLTIKALVSASTPVTLPAGTATLVNHATIDSSTPGTTTNPDPVDVPVQAKADLTLTKTPKAGTATAGEQMTWHLAVHDTGPSDAAGPLTVSDTLPAYQTYVSASPAWNCTADTAPPTPGPGLHQTVTCVLADGLAASADAPALDITTQVDTSAPAGTETNTAMASSPTPGSDGNDTGTVTVSRTAGLSVTKTHTGHGTIGQNLAFTLGVHNGGPSLADQVVVTDTLPDGLDYVAATGTDWTCTQSDRTVTCALAGSLASGQDASDITVTTLVRAAAFPSVTNTAVVGSTDPDLPGTSSADDPVVVDPSATLELVKEHLGKLVVGDDAEYRLTVTNTGPTLTPGPVEITDTLPDGVTYADATGDNWTCTNHSGVVTCSHAAGLAVGAKSVVTLTVHVGPSAYPSVTNSAKATAPGADSVSATDTASVTPTSVLSIDKKVESIRNEVATYAIAVTDEGPSATVDPVVVTDPLPDGLTYRSASGSGWVCSAADNDVTCTRHDSLSAGESSTITLRAEITAAPGEQVVNIASVVSGADGQGAESATASNPASLVAPKRHGSQGADDSSNAPADTGVNVELPLVLGGMLLLMGIVLLVVALPNRRRS